MSSALNHRRRSRRSYEKRVATMNTLQRKTVVKEYQPSFRDIFMMILRKKRQSPFKRMKSDSSR
jgi:hypothetical protein